MRRSAYFLFYLLTFLAPLLAMQRASYRVGQAPENLGCAAFMRTLIHRWRCPKDCLCPCAIAAACAGAAGTLARHIPAYMVNMIDPSNQKTLADYVIEGQATTRRRIKVLNWLIGHGLVLDFNERSPLAAALRLGDIAIARYLLKYTPLHEEILDYVLTLAESQLWVNPQFDSQFLAALNEKCLCVEQFSCGDDSLRAHQLGEQIQRLLLHQHMIIHASDPDCRDSFYDLVDWVNGQRQRSYDGDIFSDPTPPLPDSADVA